MYAEILGVEYPTKKSVLDRVEVIKNSHPHGYLLVGEEKDFIFWFLPYHPQAQQKIGNGVQEIMVNKRIPKGCNLILIRDGQKPTNFSCKKALEIRSNRKEAKAAARFSVRPQTDDYKKQHFAGISEKSNTPISYDEAEVDHIPPLTFSVLFSDFLKSIQVDIDTVEVVNVGDMQAGKLFVDRTIGERWAKYHHEHAKLRIISAEENRKAHKVRGDYELR